MKMTSPVTLFERDRHAARAAVVRFTTRMYRQDLDADAWHALGTRLQSLGDRVGACVAFRAALHLDASRAQSQRALGNLLFDSGQWDLALHCFELSERA